MLEPLTFLQTNIARLVYQRQRFKKNNQYIGIKVPYLLFY